MVNIDNTSGEHNWLATLNSKLKDLGYDLEHESVDDVLAQLDAQLNRQPAQEETQGENTYEYPIPAPPAQAEPPKLLDMKMPKTSCHIVAQLMGCDFQVGYEESGFISPTTDELVVPRYLSGKKKGLAQFQFIFRADTEQALGVVSGAYPERNGYRHVLDTMEGMFPKTCTGISVFGAGERAVIAQELDDPIDLGDGDLIQPFLYTRMSLNRTWATQCIPKMSRLSCENALGSTGAIITVKATRNHDARLTLEAEIMQESLNQAEAIRRMAFVMKDQQFTDAAFRDMVVQLIPEPESEHQASHTRRTNKIAACSQAWSNERGDTPIGNMWNAYNAIQGAEQHVINSPNTLIDESGAKYRDQAIGLAKTLDGKTPLADTCEKYLVNLLGGEERYTELLYKV